MVEYSAATSTNWWLQTDGAHGTTVLGRLRHEVDTWNVCPHPLALDLGHLPRWFVVLHVAAIVGLILATLTCGTLLSQLLEVLTSWH